VVLGVGRKLLDIFGLRFCSQLVSFMVCSDVVFTVGCPLPNLTRGVAEYLLWCYVGYHVLEDGIFLLSFLEDAMDFRF